jgi:DNA polymerase-3 subunit epsilon
LDLELTGLDPKSDRVLELCVERVIGGRVEERLATLVRPSCGRFGNQHIHGIGPADVEEAPGFEVLAPRVTELLEGTVLVAHGVRWDMAFLAAEYARLERSSPAAFAIDTLALSRRALSLERHSLEALSEHLQLTARPRHRAADDVAALRELFRHLLTVLEPTTPRDLWCVQAGSPRPRPDVVERLQRACASGRPTRLRVRRSGRSAQELDFVVTALRTNLDPPRILGYLLPSRSRTELRVDRILAVGSTEPTEDGASKPSDATGSPGPREK